MADGKTLRMRRLSQPGDGKYLFVPLDHSVSDGPVAPAAEMDGLIRTLAAGGADAVVVHKGRLKTIDPVAIDGCGIVVHLSAGTTHAADRDAKILVGDVEEAIRLGADAVSVHLNIGSDTEHAQLQDIGTISNACSAWNMPLLVMAYARGPRIADSFDHTVLAHVVNIAVDLGADLVKTSVPIPSERMADLVATCPIPVLAAGGPLGNTDLTSSAKAALDAGCRGLAVGRRIFQSADPLSTVRQLAAITHPLSTHPGAAALDDYSLQLGRSL